MASAGMTISFTVSRPEAIDGPAGGARPSGEASRPASSYVSTVPESARPTRRRGAVGIEGQRRDRSAGRPARDLVAGLGVRGHDRRPAIPGEGDRALVAARLAAWRDREDRRWGVQRSVADDLVRVGEHDPAGDQVLGQHRVGPLVDVAVPAVLPIAQELGRRAGVIGLVEVLGARQIEAPEAEDEREGHQPEEDERVAPIEPATGLTQVRIGRVRREPGGTAGAGSRGALAFLRRRTRQRRSPRALLPRAATTRGGSRARPRSRARR